MNDQAVLHSGEMVKYYVSFPRLKYVYGEAELPGHSYVKVHIDPLGRHLRRQWFRADGMLATREELQYDESGMLIRVEAFDALGGRKGFTVYKYLTAGVIAMHRFDASGKPSEVIEERRNERGFLVWEHHQSVVEHGSGLKTVLKIHYSYPEPGIRQAEYFDEDGELSHKMIDHFNESGDLIATEKIGEDDLIVSRSEYLYDAGGRVHFRIDSDIQGNVTARVDYQS